MIGTDRQIDVCVCTFRRPSLADTLASLIRCAVPDGWTVRIVVIDNDDEPSAKALVAASAAASPVPIDYVHAPGRNISIARNAALDAATGRLMAFIDDDEVATAGWLDCIVAVWAETGADVVLGPVDATYAADAPRWMRRGRFHATRPVWVGGEIRTGYSCNVLIDRASPALVGRRFRLELGRSGGEDTEFFHRMHAAGARIAYAPDALLTEPVPRSRQSFGWLMRRRFRSGQTHSLIVRDRRGGSGGRTLLLVKAASKVAVCGLAAAGLMFNPVRARAWALRGALHAGVMASLLGARDLQQYGRVDDPGYAP
ncbi:glycosyltransferase family 2 protein [Chthonobacter rhizosphaerae]|uniref:glycosyltransferase family 2 protein n=1 Tax=Chthonobacter rhizosphaerae TaxID=2735553 RepID=UPI0015EF7903|nr:glycosyltransferase [Chthonobacter rhizosphaerae]